MNGLMERSPDHNLSFQVKNSNVSRMVDENLYAIRALMTRGVRIYHMADTLHKVLSLPKYSKEQLKDTLRDKFLLSKEDAGQLVTHLFLEARSVNKIDSVDRRIIHF